MPSASTADGVDVGAGILNLYIRRASIDSFFNELQGYGMWSSCGSNPVHDRGILHCTTGSSKHCQKEIQIRFARNETAVFIQFGALDLNYHLVQRPCLRMADARTELPSREERFGATREVVDRLDQFLVSPGIP